MNVDKIYFEIVSYIVGGFGSLLVLTSFMRLGITGTYCGDYFGIQMEKRVTNFPFNICEDPMYLGSTLNFLSVAIFKQSFAGLTLTALVYIVYYFYSVTIENSFTNWYYSDANAIGRAIDAGIYPKMTESKNASTLNSKTK